MYYTYAYLREDGTPYYIGKGVNNRIRSKNRLVPAPPEDRMLILKQNLSEEEAFKHEIYMIAVFGRKDVGTGILRNRTNGGDGTSGWVPTDETKQKIGLANSKKSRTKEVRAKISESVKGFKWYNDGVRSIQSRQNPGEGWAEGRLMGWKSPRNKGMKWYHRDGIRRQFAEDPGEGWQLGMPKPKGKRYYNNGSEHVLAYEPPDETWVLGRLRKS